jgi:hypothetical protein
VGGWMSCACKALSNGCVSLEVNVLMAACQANKQRRAWARDHFAKASCVGRIYCGAFAMGPWCTKAVKVDSR